jgi:glycosyltransferase involved in cell wall biosynthesis
MRVAIVHELLTIKGGAEKVAKIFADMFPEAPIYTLLYNKEAMSDWFPANRVRTSMLQNKFKWLPANVRFNHHLYLKHFPAAVEAWDFSEFDLVISSSSAFAHGIITNSAPKHISYVHSPARYLWDRAHDVLSQQTQPLLGPLRQWHLARMAHQLRQWDTIAAPRADLLLAASQGVQRRIELYWRQPSQVLTPPIDDFWFTSNPHARRSPQHPPRFLIVSTLARYKRIDIAIAACKAGNFDLAIVGTGPDEARLKKLAGPTVHFLGRKNGEDLRALYTSATATIFPGDEDFGLVPLESLACGTPVVAFASGGALETLNVNTAEFFQAPTSESLLAALQALLKRSFTTATLTAQAGLYRREHFCQALQNSIVAVTGPKTK